MKKQVNNHTLVSAVGEQRIAYGCKTVGGTPGRGDMIMSSYTRGAIEVALLAGLLSAIHEPVLKTMFAERRYLEALELIEGLIRAEQS